MAATPDGTPAAGAAPQPEPAAVEVEVHPGGATVRVGGVVRATFTGDMAEEADRAALAELVAELFGR
jgi:hypothetical protein